ncbi:hypothetical protein [Dysgonomonas termitidis]|uniref:Bacteriocin n=1 Tax=Dysgonomonas termitidis TaxID=1516126 RepID=A0ABV9L386_9BACT
MKVEKLNESAVELTELTQKEMRELEGGHWFIDYLMNGWGWDVTGWTADSRPNEIWA